MSLNHCIKIFFQDCVVVVVAPLMGNNSSCNCISTLYGQCIFNIIGFIFSQSEGTESQVFKAKFVGWDDVIGVDFTRTAQSVQRTGADLNKWAKKQAQWNNNTIILNIFFHHHDSLKYYLLSAFIRFFIKPLLKVHANSAFNKTCRYRVVL